MSSISGTQTARFQATNLPGLPAVLVAQIQQMNSAAVNVELLLLQNPALLMQVIQHRELLREPAALKQIAAQLSELDQAWLGSLLHNLALRQCLAGEAVGSGIQARLWSQLRTQGLLADALARQLGYAHPAGAAIAATLGGIGLLIQEAAQGSTWATLYADTASLPELLQAEQTLYGTHHVQIATDVLEYLQLDTGIVDSARYQAASVLEIRDASLLVRIVWLARFFSSQLKGADEGALTTAERIAGLGTLSMQALLKRVADQLNDETRQLNLQALLPVAGEQAPVLTLHMENQQRQLKQLLLQQSAFASIEREIPQSPEMLRDMLVRLLRQAGVTGGFILLAEQPGTGCCTIVLQHGSELNADEFSIRCEPGRSALATAVLSQSLTTLVQDSRHLTVVDRQFIRALGNAGLVCEPVSVGQCHGALLLAANPAYAGQTALRQLVRQKLVGYLDREDTSTDAPVPEDLIRYQQQVRETVHEINNPLSILRNYCQLFAMKSDGLVKPEELSQLKNEIDRMAGLLASLREVAPAPAASLVCDLNAVVETLGPVLGAALSGTAPHTIDIEMRCVSGALPVRITADALKQILTNLVKNAAEACPAGGTIKIATKANVVFMDNLYSQLVITDNGSGIPADRMQGLFLQTKSTKGEQHFGAGLGIVKRLMDEIQGIISCQSDSNGTAFFLLFPQVQ